MYTKTFCLLLLSLYSATHAKKQTSQSRPAPTPTYSCSAVLADNYYVPTDQTIIVNAQVDCVFFTGLGKAETTTAIPIDIPASKIFKVPSFTQDTAYTLEALKFYPAQGQLFAFEYQPIKGKFKNIPIQVVIRTEPLDQNFINILTMQQQTLPEGNSIQAQKIGAILNHPEEYAKVVFYRRLPAAGEDRFTPKHTKVFKNSEQKIADVHILPTGNIQIIDHASTGEQFLVEEPFGKL